jgi:hypothetical protein
MFVLSEVHLPKFSVYSVPNMIQFLPMFFILPLPAHAKLPILAQPVKGYSSTSSLAYA